MKAPKIKLMEVCGTHTMEIARSGIKRLLPKDIELISGPGCPVCVTAQDDIDRAVEISQKKDVIMTTFGDMLRVPGSRGSLEDAKGEGADIRVVYSCTDALDIARNNPGKTVIFMGIGFETTSPTVAATVIKAKKEKVTNFFVLSAFKLIFPALEALSASRRVAIDGFMCPGHVSVITGSKPYEAISRRYRKPCVITGFETADILKGIERLVKKVKSRKYGVEIAYERAVTKSGNKTAKAVLNSVFEPADSAWRGLGVIKRSGLRLRKKYASFDAEKKFKVKLPKTNNAPRGCICGEVLLGAQLPPDCGLFKKKCTPRHPVGPCMVSSEGTCAAYYKYGK